MIYDETLAPRTSDGRYVIVDPLDPTRRKRIATTTPSEELLVPVFRGGRPVYRSPTLGEIRARAQKQLDCLHPGIRRFVNPHQYPVGLEVGLHELKTRLVLEAREASAGAG
jgi:nicotinate phosphoribosyltransferase